MFDLTKYWKKENFDLIGFVVDKYNQGKKNPQMKPQRFPKVGIWKFGWLVHQINSLYKVLKLK